MASDVLQLKRACRQSNELKYLQWHVGFGFGEAFTNFKETVKFNDTFCNFCA